MYIFLRYQNKVLYHSVVRYYRICVSFSIEFESKSGIFSFNCFHVFPSRLVGKQYCTQNKNN